MEKYRIQLDIVAPIGGYNQAEIHNIIRGLIEKHFCNVEASSILPLSIAKEIENSKVIDGRKFKKIFNQ